MSLRNTFHLIHTDYRRYIGNGFPTIFHVIFFAQGFWASTTFRFSYWAKYNLHLPIIRQIVRGLLAISQKVMEIITGISIPPTCKIGEGFYIAHFGPIVITSNSEIGNNCFISHYVTLGWKPSGKYAGYPHIGDRVFIGPNSIILGGISIGNDVLIGAGSVVTKSIPDRSVVAGNPAKIISSSGSFELVKFDNMENDIERNKSLALLSDSYRNTYVGTE